MTFRIGRTTKINDTLELTDKSGNVAKRLNIELDIDATAKELTEKYSDFICNHNKLKELQKADLTDDFAALANQYAENVIELFQICFGKANTAEIFAFYEGNYFEMVQSLIPYIFKRLFPEIKKSVKKQKNMLKKAFKYKL